MSNNLAHRPLLLVGSGQMAVEYSKVLRDLKIPFRVIGRGQTSAKVFTEKTGIHVYTGGLESWLNKTTTVPLNSIVTVGIEQLLPSTMQLLQAGAKRILVEKPAGKNISEIERLAGEAKKNKAEVFVAYNRRFYNSVLSALKMIEEDGGVTSFTFDFTERSYIIEKLATDPAIKSEWFLANSTHVIDLAFFIGGSPKILNTLTKKGNLSWHPLASGFVGSGVTENGALFSYHANWEAPGNWGLEVLTNKRKFIFKPLEELYIQDMGSSFTEKVLPTDDLDIKYKPGIYKQVQAFWGIIKEPYLLSLEEHCLRVKKIFLPIRLQAL